MTHSPNAAPAHDRLPTPLEFMDAKREAAYVALEGLKVIADEKTLIEAETRLQAAEAQAQQADSSFLGSRPALAAAIEFGHIARLSQRDLL